MTEEFQEINCIGLKCPLPVLRLEKAVRNGAKHITILADDPISIIDIPAAAIQQGATYSTRSLQNGVYQFVIVLETP